MTSYKNIIFDFGGVIIDIDYDRIRQAFRAAGVSEFESLYTQFHQHGFFDDFERGRISTDIFRDRIREITALNLTDAQIDDAWNAILIGLPAANIELLRRLKSSHRIFLLSNTNALHEEAFTRMILQDFGMNVLDEVFEKVYYSHRLNMRKPDTDIFLHVLNENNLVAEETLFIDDSPQHVEGAKRAGLHALLLEPGKKISDVFPVRPEAAQMLSTKYSQANPTKKPA